VLCVVQRIRGSPWGEPPTVGVTPHQVTGHLTIQVGKCRTNCNKTNKTLQGDMNCGTLKERDGICRIAKQRYYDLSEISYGNRNCVLTKHNLTLICKFDAYPNHMMFPSHTRKLEYFTPVEIILRGSH
jgi:hypothetical protein